MKVIKAILTRLLSVVFALVVTLALFLILPIMQAIGEKNDDTIEAEAISIALEQPPPDVQEEEQDPPEDVEDPPEPPEVELDDQPMMTDLSQLDLLGGSGGISIPGVDNTINLDQFDTGGGLDDLFDPGALDQPARVLFQAQPKMTPALRKKTPAVVVVAFIVDPSGRVSEVSVLKSSDTSFNTAAINAVKKWRFEPAQRGGKPIEARIRQTIEFPK